MIDENAKQIISEIQELQDKLEEMYSDWVVEFVE
jgi:hypothetical protein